MVGRLAQFSRYTFFGRFVPSDVIPFVIVYSARTGSNYLAAALDSHPQILCHHEVFNRGGIHRSLSYKNTDLSFGTVAERNRDPWAFINRIYSFKGGKEAVGFKLAPRVNDWALLSLLLARPVRKIVLGRRSWLHAYTSEQIAAKTQRWIERADRGDGQPQPKVRVDPAKFRIYAKKRRLFYGTCRAILRATGQSYFRMDYEEIGDPERMAALLVFLSVDAHVPLQARTARQNSPDLADRIENLDEVRVALRGSRDDADLAG